MLWSFQFHYGTIKSVKNKGVTGDVLYFNSTMVRLKDGSTVNIYPRSIDFNSTMVRLKGNLMIFLIVPFLNFNSTMVRLKVRSVPNDVFAHIIFQFHYGTIKRLLKNAIPLFFRTFQFHYGTIKSRRIDD